MCICSTINLNLLMISKSPVTPINTNLQLVQHQSILLNKHLTHKNFTQTLAQVKYYTYLCRRKNENYENNSITKIRINLLVDIPTK